MNREYGLVVLGMNILGQLPLLIVWLVGMILAVKNWQAYPKVSLLALIGFVTLILQSIVFSVVSMLLPEFLRQSSFSTSEIGMYFSVFGLVRSFFSAISWGFIVAAIFTYRYKHSV